MEKKEFRKAFEKLLDWNSVEPSAVGLPSNQEDSKINSEKKTSLQKSLGIVRLAGSGQCTQTYPPEAHAEFDVIF